VAWFVNALRTTNVESRSSGNIVAFHNAVFAGDAVQLDFSFTISEINVEVRGQFAGKGTLSENEASFIFGISGSSDRSVPSLKVSLPYTEVEFVQRMEREIDSRLGGESGAKISRLRLPYAGK